MDKDSPGQIENTGRRRFLKSLLGLGGGTASAESQVQPAQAKTVKEDKSHTGGVLFWTNLKTGNVGFPGGLQVPHERPGSIMKIITAAALLDEGLLSHQEIFDCTGSLKVAKPGEPQQTTSCPGPHGQVSLETAIGLSCNCFFAHNSLKLSSATIIGYAAKFGLDRPAAGFAPGAFPKAPKSSLVDYAIGLACDLQPNALQLMRLSALVAQNGEITPFKNMMGEADPAFKLVLKDNTFHHIQKGMQLVCEKGTGKNLDPEHKLHIAAKTGTIPHGQKFRSWITGYFPYNNPDHAFCLYAPSGRSVESAIPQARLQLQKFLNLN
ncbi:MAG: penicillin-binding transpeptidase domain-containing protein [Candidatus Melainabacteria bacterium]|nr:penicillin-binding transpeptidase domain-containing protein [Candidatus Melainabacteria bacterium]